MGYMLPAKTSDNRSNRNQAQTSAEFRPTRVGTESIQVGAFVCARIRNVGGVNEVMNLGNIRVPSIESTPAVQRTAPAPATARPSP